MVFPILGANTESAAYEIENSLRFNSSDTARLGKTISGTSNRKTFSMSFWLKKTKISGYGGIFGVGTATSDTGKLQIRIDGSDNLKIEGGSTTYRVTDREFRDVSAWYNIFISFDSTQSTAGNRILIYVNGVQETSFSTSNNPSQDANTPFNEDGKTHYIGTEGDGSSAALDGYLAEFHYIDGTKKAYTDFGEFDDNGVWIPKEYDGSYGTHGFYFQFKQTGTSANSSGMGADTSGNDNHYTPNNLAATDVTTDTPTNNFCTLNSISYPSGLVTSLQNGSLDLLTTDSPYGAVPATFGLTNGKWYWEIKVNASSDYDRIGLVGTEVPITTSFDFGDTNLGGGAKTNLAYKSNDGKTRKDGTDQNYGNSYTSGDIIGVAYNADDGEIYFYKNGTVQNSGTAAYTNLDGLTLIPAVGDGVANASGQYFCNFGNPTFSISSGNADANGYGNFEYAPPSGYYSLCTKNLAEFG